MRDAWFLVLVFGFTAGVAFRSFVDLGFFFTIFLAVVAAALLLFFFVRRERNVFLVSLLIISFGLGIFRFDIGERNHGDPFLDARIGDHVSVIGTVSEEPDERIGRTNLTVDITELRDGENVQPIDTRVHIITERYPSFAYGDEIAISGKILLPKNFENEETGKIFDYVSYLAKDGIFYQFIRPNIERVGEEKGSVVKRGLLSLKHKFLNNVSRVIPEPESSLLGGLLVGAKQSLGEELLKNFRIAGVIHIVVLSGYNLTIVAEAIMRFFSFAPRMWGLSLGGAAIILFSIMTGAGATVVRASLMALLALIARATGRIYEITLALLLAGFVMLLYNPKILVFDPSFQLSFLATLGLIHFAPIAEKFFSWVPKNFGIRNVVSATLATQIAVLPLLLFMTGAFSLISLPANLLILPFIPLTMLFGFLAGVFSFVSYLLSFPFALITHLLLSYELAVVEYAVRIPLASIGGISVGVLFTISMYCVLLYVIWKLSSLKSKTNENH